MWPPCSAVLCLEQSLDTLVAQGLPPEQKETLDELQISAEASDDPAEVLMKAVPAVEVALDWDNAVQLTATSTFWGTNAGDARDYQRSKHVPLANRFVTHSWSPPNNWEEIMGKDCDYGDVKATELKVVAEDIATQLGCQWGDVSFWIDKCCIPQRHALMPTCVSLIEDFIQRCDGMVVLLSWQYFERLWCVYEWAAFLVYHDAKKVQICVDAFMRPASKQLYLDSIEIFSVGNAKCYHEPDRQVLKDKVAEYYVSEEAFELFAR